MGDYEGGDGFSPEMFDLRANNPDPRTKLEKGFKKLIKSDFTEAPE